MSERELAKLNALPRDVCERELLKCCGSQRWAQSLSQEQPFADSAELERKADEVWWRLERNDWLEAFRSHPKIGERKASAPTTTTAKRWSEQEQAGMSEAASETVNELAELNRQYEEKFGYIFIVCATGKGADEMLALLRERLANDADVELRIAATEQAKITKLRIRKLLNL